MLSTDTIDDKDVLFLTSREYAFYLLRFCLINQLKKNPDVYIVSNWDRTLRFSTLTDDDCCEIRDSEIVKCCHLPSQIAIKFLEVLKDRCKDVGFNCTSKENATHPSGSSWSTDYLIRDMVTSGGQKENATTLIGSPCATDYTILTTSAYLILGIILIATIIMIIFFFFFFCKIKKLNNGLLYMRQYPDDPKCLTSEPKNFY